MRVSLIEINVFVLRFFVHIMMVKSLFYLETNVCKEVLTLYEVNYLLHIENNIYKNACPYMRVFFTLDRNPISTCMYHITGHYAKCLYNKQRFLKAVKMIISS